MRRDGQTKSIRQEAKDYKPQIDKKSKDFDVAIIGAGITGLSTALLLQEAGKKCILIEAETVWFGTTSGTTAHLNTYIENSYPDLITNFWLQNAKLVPQSMQEALDSVQRLIKKYKINAQFKQLDAHLFAQTDDETKELDKQIQGSKRVGTPMYPTSTLPIDISFHKAVILPDQAQIHPTAYILWLARSFEKLWGIIQDNCNYKNIEKIDDELHISTSKGTIIVDDIVLATHLPVGKNMFSFLCAPYRTYVIGAEVDKPFDALVYDLEDPYHYRRGTSSQGKHYIIVGWEDHKTAHEKSTDQPFKKLEAYARKHYPAPIKKITYKRSAQYYNSPDGLPYIWRMPGEKHMYVATGFGGMGITFGSFAGILLTDLITKGKNKYEKLYNPSRFKPVASMKTILKEWADVACRIVLDRLSLSKNAAGLKRNTGKIIKQNGTQVAISKDAKGKITTVSAVCPHAGCIVQRNGIEQSRDCPCHGSRFTPQGKRLEGPALRDLEKIN